MDKYRLRIESGTYLDTAAMYLKGLLYQIVSIANRLYWIPSVVEVDDPVYLFFPSINVLKNILRLTSVADVYIQVLSM